MQLLYTLGIPLFLLFVFRRFSGRYYFMQIGLVWLAVCAGLYLLACAPCGALFTPRRISCAEKMKLVGVLLSSKENITARNWYVSIRDKVAGSSFLKCPGLGACDDVSYLFVPAGMDNDKYPVLVEYLHNHLEKGEDYLFFTLLTDSGGMNVLFRDSRRVWLSPQEARQLEKQFAENKVFCYDQHGRITKFYHAKSKCFKCIASIQQVIFANTCMAITFVFIGMAGFYLKKKRHMVGDTEG